MSLTASNPMPELWQMGLIQPAEPMTALGQKRLFE
jgi:hypothetical protein